ncbi:hypothetical protein C2845_PM12G18770 [Panicum miliaceum]|uniref:Uncharacterized protein n=1 Tax=Panicum miliaceum TaxID=4540 RepID=A0A3L6QHY2_PANMI|nr:hypothetical protein C2845_PM12G18770 [Panicum miliaceum]
MAMAYVIQVAPQARTTEGENKAAEVQDWRGGGYCRRWGCCNSGYYGGCRCCAHPDQVLEPMYRPEFVEVHN